MSPFDKAVAAFEAAHQEDPQEVRGRPWASIYHERLSHWVERLAPDGSEPLRLAAWCQHIRRWTIPRSDYPEGVTGYKKWRSTLAQFHAKTAEEILLDAGYDQSTADRVRDFLIKKGLKKDPEVQAFEDAICLTFMENQLADFKDKHDKEKMLGILRKTWAKMSDSGHTAARELAAELPDDARALVQEAIA